MSAELRPAAVVTVEREKGATAAELIAEAARALSEGPALASDNALWSAVSALIDAAEIIDARLRKAGM